MQFVLLRLFLLTSRSCCLQKPSMWPCEWEQNKQGPDKKSNWEKRGDQLRGSTSPCQFADVQGSGCRTSTQRFRILSCNVQHTVQPAFSTHIKQSGESLQKHLDLRSTVNLFQFQPPFDRVGRLLHGMESFKLLLTYLSQNSTAGTRWRLHGKKGTGVVDDRIRKSRTIKGL